MGNETAINTETYIANSSDIIDEMGQVKSSDTSTRLNKVWTEWSLRVNLDCYAKIFEYTNNLVAQGIWCVLLLGSICTTFWIVSLSISNYLDYDVVSKIRNVYEMPPVEFPAVTICDFNAFTSHESENLFLHLANVNNVSLKQTSDNIEILTRLAKMNASVRSQNYDSYRKSLGLFSLKNIASCYFNHEKCNLEQMFSWYYSFDYGNCLQFNAGRDG